MSESRDSHEWNEFQVLLFLMKNQRLREQGTVSGTIVRTEEGFIQGKTVLGRNMCKNLNFHIRRTDLYWKIHILYQIQEKLEQLYDEKKLEEEEKNFYIESNRLLKCYIKEAFAKGE